MNTPNILLVEDQIDILEINRTELLLCCYNVFIAQTFKQAKELIQMHQPDLIVLDIMLPDGSGVDLCREIRQAFNGSILFLTALQESEQLLKALAAGGDDYIKKPYSTQELVARVKAQLARTQRIKQSFEKVDFGPLTLDYTMQRAYLDGENIMLKPKEFMILSLLIRSGKEYLTAGQLYESVWGLDSNNDIHTVLVHISNLRSKLTSDNDRQIVRIERSTTLGYRIIITDDVD